MMKNFNEITVKELNTLLEKMKKRLAVSNHSQQTIVNYIRAVEYMCKHTGKTPVTDYLYQLQYQKFRAWRTIKIYVAGLRWYYTHMLDDEKFAFKIPYPKEEQDLPIILSRNELLKLFVAAENSKHKLMLMMTYASGLRRNELLNLKIEDIDTYDGKFRLRINRSIRNYGFLSSRNKTPMLEKLFEYFELPEYKKPKVLLVFELLKRVHNVEIGICKHCGGRMIVIESKDRPRAKSRASPLVIVA